MKKLLLFLLILNGVLLNAQNDRILFTYDAAGNQIKRAICINCSTGKQAINKSDLTAADLIKSDISDKIFYYPNPVQEELYVKWILIEDKKVENISVYNMNGALLQKFTDFKTDDLQRIPFSDYPGGMYIVAILYNNGERKDLKILKR